MSQPDAGAGECTGQTLQEAVARDIVLAEVRAWARRIGVEHRLYEVHLRPMKRKWASISTRGRLTLNLELLRQPAAFRREVIVHELVHLRVPRHGKLFRALFRAYLNSQPLHDMTPHTDLDKNNR